MLPKEREGQVYVLELGSYWDGQEEPGNISDSRFNYLFMERVKDCYGLLDQGDSTPGRPMFYELMTDKDTIKKSFAYSIAELSEYLNKLKEQHQGTNGAQNCITQQGQQAEKVHNGITKHMHFINNLADTCGISLQDTFNLPLNIKDFDNPSSLVDASAYMPVSKAFSSFLIKYPTAEKAFKAAGVKEGIRLLQSISQDPEEAFHDYMLVGTRGISNIQSALPPLPACPTSPQLGCGTPPTSNFGTTANMAAQAALLVVTVAALYKAARWATTVVFGNQEQHDQRKER